MKTTAMLVAMLVLALPALALAQDAATTAANETDEAVVEDTGLEGGDNVEISESSTRPVLNALGVLGKGIAVSPDDPMDFMLVKLGLGAVKVTVDGEVRRAAIGVLVLDGVKYRLKSVSVADGQATGDIYDNGSQAGSFDVSSVMKEDVEVWAGEMELNGETYHLYILEGARRIRAQELGDKVADYCRNNPDDTNCRDRVESFCESSPEDSRCKAIFRKYCIAGNNMDDVRCREFVRGYCEENQELSECVTLGVKRARSYCDEHPNAALCGKIEDRLVNFCRNNPDNEGCVRAKELVKNRAQVLSRLNQHVTKTLAELRSTAAEGAPSLTNTALTSEEA